MHTPAKRDLLARAFVASTLKTGHFCQQGEETLKTQPEHLKNLSQWLIFQDLESLRGKNVLIVEDIIDTGRTMKKLLNPLNK